MRILVIGGSGFLGTELVRQSLAAGHRTSATYHSRPRDTPGPDWHRLDLRAPDAIDALLTATNPEVVVNTGADLAAWATTADGAVHIARSAARRGTRLVHVSSDAVFSGADVHYVESSTPDPITPYGAAKAAAETAIRIGTPDAAIVRTSLIIGDGTSIHEHRIHALAADPSGVLFTDDVRCPVHVTDLAAAILELSVSDVGGMFHCAGSDAVNRHRLGMLVAARDGLDPTRLPTGLRRGSGIPGPLDVRLDSTATQRRLRTRLRGAHEFLGAATETASNQGATPPHQV